METTESLYLRYMIDSFFENLQLTRTLDDNPSDEEFENSYALGYNLFTYGNYTAAREIFTALAYNAPYTAHYWRALGAVNQQMEDYPEAIAAYDMAIANDELDFVSYVYQGESYILSGSVESALDNFKKVVDLGVSYPEFAVWVRRAELLLQVHQLRADQ